VTLSTGTEGKFVE